MKASQKMRAKSKPTSALAGRTTTKKTKQRRGIYRENDKHKETKA